MSTKTHVTTFGNLSSALGFPYHLKDLHTTPLSRSTFIYR